MSRIRSRAVKTLRLARMSIRRQRFKADHVGRRSVGWKRLEVTGAVFEKRLDQSAAGQEALARELLARSVFAESGWVTPILSQERRSIRLPLLPDESRLDHVAPAASPEERREMARQAIEILFELFAKGYAHRDFHGGNIFWVDGQLYVVDFEALERYPDGARPPFPCSYDLTGEGLPPSFGAPRAYYDVPGSPVSIAHLLGVTAAEALRMLETRLEHDLWAASVTFQALNRRHATSTQLIYNSFALPFLRVAPDEAQRDSGRRLRRFGITEQLVRGRRVLDLGSNIGGMLFEMQCFTPGECLGLEYDQQKVKIATEVAAYNALHNVRFMQADIDHLDAGSLPGPFDVVSCLAIIEHVKDKPHLFDLLGKVTGGTLLFEGNAGSDVPAIEAALRHAGFREIELLGMSDDDIRPENNCRPIWRAAR